MKALVTCIVAGIQYLVHPQVLGSIEETINPNALLPITLLTTDEIFGDIDGLLSLLDSVDDVFNPDFGGVLVEKPGPRKGEYVTVQVNGTERPVYHLEDFGAFGDDIAELPSGPYFLRGSNLHQAWRLYDDQLGAFTFGVVPENVTDPDEFEVLSALSLEGDFKAVPVPSRLYHPRPSARKPLSGLRFSISDSLSLRGVPRTLSSRAWSSLYPSGVDSTADYVQVILNLGAVIVGKTKITQFGTLGVDGEWVDEQAPWSPRGDGYQKISGSAPGAAAALMGYGWMDHAVGDGVFANQEGLYSLTYDRFSYGFRRKRTTENILLFSRSLEDLERLAPTPRKLDAPEIEFPKQILWPTDNVSSVPIGHRYVMTEFLNVLEKFLGTKAKSIDIAKSWDSWAGNASLEPDLQKYMKDAFYLTNSFVFRHTYENFEADYIQDFGRKPYFEPTPKLLWDTGKNVTYEEAKGQAQRILSFKVWFNTYIMNSLVHSCDAIMVLPCDAPGVRYRDEPAEPPSPIEGVTPKTIGQLLWITQLIVPFTQIPYESRISGGVEYLPFCASIFGSKDSEKMLVKLVKEAFEAAKWPVRVQTGRMAFSEDIHPREQLSDEL